MTPIPTWLVLIAAGVLAVTVAVDVLDWARQRLTVSHGRLTRRWYRPGRTVWHRERGPMVVRTVDTTAALACPWVYAESAIEGRDAAWLPSTDIHATVSDLTAAMDAADDSGE